MESKETIKKEQKPTFFYLDFDEFINMANFSDQEVENLLAEKKSTNCLIKGDTLYYLGPIPPSSEHAEAYKFIKLQNISLWKHVFEILGNKHNCKFILTSRRLANLYDPGYDGHGHVEPMLTALDEAFTSERTFLRLDDTIDLMKAAEKNRKRDEKLTPQSKRSIPALLIKHVYNSYPNATHYCFNTGAQEPLPVDAEDCIGIPYVENLDGLPYPAVDMLINVLGIKKAIEEILKMSKEHSSLLMLLLIERYGNKDEFQKILHAKPELAIYQEIYASWKKLPILPNATFSQKQTTSAKEKDKEANKTQLPSRSEVSQSTLNLSGLEEKHKHLAKKHWKSDPDISTTVSHLDPTHNQIPTFQNKEAFIAYVLEVLWGLRGMYLEKGREIKNISDTQEQVIKSHELHEDLKKIITNLRKTYRETCNSGILILHGKPYSLTGLLRPLQTTKNAKEFFSLCAQIANTLTQAAFEYKQFKRIKPWERPADLSFESAPKPETKKSKQTPEAALHTDRENSIMAEDKKQTDTSSSQTTISIPSDPTPTPAGIIYFNVEVLNTYDKHIAERKNDYDIIGEYTAQTQKARYVSTTRNRKLAHGQAKIIDHAFYYGGPDRTFAADKVDHYTQKLDSKGKPIPDSKVSPEQRHIKLEYVSLWKCIFETLTTHNFQVVPVTPRLSDLHNSTSPSSGYIEPMLTALNTVYGTDRTFLTERDATNLVIEARKPDPITHQPPIEDMHHGMVPFLDAGKKLFPNAKKRIFLTDSEEEIKTAHTKGYQDTIHANKFINCKTNPNKLPYHAVELLVKALGSEKAILEISKMPQEHADILLPLLIEHLHNNKDRDLAIAENPQRDASADDRTIANKLAFYRKIYQAKTDEKLVPESSKISVSGLKALFTKSTLEEQALISIIEGVKDQKDEGSFPQAKKFLDALNKYIGTTTPDIGTLKNLISHFYNASKKNCYAYQLTCFGHPFSLSKLFGLLCASKNLEEFKFLYKRIYQSSEPKPNLTINTVIKWVRPTELPAEPIQQIVSTTTQSKQTIRRESVSTSLKQKEKDIKDSKTSKVYIVNFDELINSYTPDKKSQQNAKDESKATITRENDTLNFSGPIPTGMDKAVANGFRHIKIEYVSVLKSIFNVLEKRGFKLKLVSQRLSNAYNVSFDHFGHVQPMLNALNEAFGEDRQFFLQTDITKISNQIFDKNEKNLSELLNHNDFLAAAKKLFPASKHIYLGKESESSIRFQHPGSLSPHNYPFYAIKMLIDALGIEEAIKEISKMLVEQIHVILPLLIKSEDSSVSDIGKLLEKPILDFYKKINRASTPTELAKIFDGEIIPLSSDVENAFIREINESKGFDVLKDVLKSEADTVISNEQELIIHTKKFLLELQKYYQEKFPETEDLSTLHAFLTKIVAAFWTHYSSNCDKYQLTCFGTSFSLSKLLHLLHTSENLQEFNLLLDNLHRAMPETAQEDSRASSIKRINTRSLPTSKTPITIKSENEGTPKTEEKLSQQTKENADKTESTTATKPDTSEIAKPKDAKKTETPTPEKKTESKSTEPEIQEHKAGPGHQSTSSSTSSETTLPLPSSSPSKHQPMRMPPPIVPTLATSETTTSKAVETKETNASNKKKEEKIEIVIYFNVDKTFNTFGEGTDAINDFDVIEMPLEDERPNRARKLTHGQTQRVHNNDIFYLAGPELPFPAPVGGVYKQKLDHKNQLVFKKDEKNPIILQLSQLHVRFDHVTLWNDVFNTLTQHHVKVVPLSNLLVEIYDERYCGYVEPLFSSLNAAFGKQRAFLTEQDAINLVIETSKPNSLGKKPIENVRDDDYEKNSEKKSTQVPFLNAGKQIFSTASRHILVSHQEKDIASAKSAGYEAIQVDSNTLTNNKDPIRHPYHAIDMLITALGKEKAIDAILNMPQHANVLWSLLAERLHGTSELLAIEKTKSKSKDKDEQSAAKTLAYYRKFYTAANDQKATPPLTTLLQSFLGGSTTLTAEEKAFIKKIEAADEPATAKQLLAGEESQDKAEPKTSEEKTQKASESKTTERDAKAKPTPMNLLRFYLKPKTETPVKFKTYEIINIYTAHFLRDLQTYSVDNHEKNDVDIHNTLKEIIRNFYTAFPSYNKEHNLLTLHKKSFSIPMLLNLLYTSENLDQFKQFWPMVYEAIRSGAQSVTEPKAAPKVGKIQQVEIWQRPADLFPKPAASFVVPETKADKPEDGFDPDAPEMSGDSIGVDHESDFQNRLSKLQQKHGEIFSTVELERLIHTNATDESIQKVKERAETLIAKHGDKHKGLLVLCALQASNDEEVEKLLRLQILKEKYEEKLHRYLEILIQEDRNDGYIDKVLTKIKTIPDKYKDRIIPQTYISWAISDKSVNAFIDDAEKILASIKVTVPQDKGEREEGDWQNLKTQAAFFAHEDTDAEPSTPTKDNEAKETKETTDTRVQSSPVSQTVTLSPEEMAGIMEGLSPVKPVKPGATATAEEEDEEQDEEHDEEQDEQQNSEDEITSQFPLSTPSDSQLPVVLVPDLAPTEEEIAVAMRAQLAHLEEEEKARTASIAGLENQTLSTATPAEQTPKPSTQSTSSFVRAAAEEEEKSKGNGRLDGAGILLENKTSTPAKSESKTPSKNKARTNHALDIVAAGRKFAHENPLAVEYAIVDRERLAAAQNNAPPTPTFAERLATIKSHHAAKSPFVVKTREAADREKLAEESKTSVSTASTETPTQSASGLSSAAKAGLKNFNLQAEAARTEQVKVKESAAAGRQNGHDDHANSDSEEHENYVY